MIYEGTCLYNLRAHGFLGTSVIDSSAYKKFYLTLQAVGEPTGPPYFPIDEERRRLIRQAGPQSSWLMDQLESNAVAKAQGITFYGKSDIPSGWFHWAVFNAVFTASHGDLRESFARLQVIEDEIAGANRRGIFKLRPIIPLPDTRLGIVESVFLRALGNAIDKMLDEPAPDFMKTTAAMATYTDPDFNAALNRRHVTESPVRVRVESHLVEIYSTLYTRALFYLLLATLAVCIGASLWKWRALSPPTNFMLAQQFFPALFFVFLLWYALFDASGMPVLDRYMIAQHLLLPSLIVYYLALIARRLRTDASTSL